MSKTPEGVVISGHLYLEVDALLKKIKKAKKAATKSYEAFYGHKIKEWIEDGEDVNIRSERENLKQTSKNIAHAIDAIIDSIEATKEQA